MSDIHATSEDQTEGASTVEVVTDLVDAAQLAASTISSASRLLEGDGAANALVDLVRRVEQLEAILEKLDVKVGGFANIAHTVEHFFETNFPHILGK